MMPRARTAPSTPPTSATTTLSTISWRTTAARVAPIAPRMATSRRREVPRVSSRLATLAHAISSRKATAPSSSHTPRLVESRTKLLRNASTLTECPWRGSDRIRSSAASSARRLALASGSSTSSLSRAMTNSDPESDRTCISVKTSGSQILLCW